MKCFEAEGYIDNITWIIIECVWTKVVDKLSSSKQLAMYNYDKKLIIG